MQTIVQKTVLKSVQLCDAIIIKNSDVNEFHVLYSFQSKQKRLNLFHVHIPVHCDCQLDHSHLHSIQQYCQVPTIWFQEMVVRV